MKKNYKIILLLVTLILFLINSKDIINVFLEYTKLFITKLFPVSFTLLTISTLLINYGLLNMLPINITSIYIYILSFISGFPSGSKYTKDLLNKNIITKEEAYELIKFSHFPNPMFILGSVNSVLNKNICLKLLISIMLSNLIILIFSKKHKSKIINHYKPKDFSYELSTTIINSFKIIIIIYGTSIFFYLISYIITKYISFNSYTYVLIAGLFDLTNGVFSAAIINNTIIRSLFILFFISFGGISIHMQVKSIVGNDIPYKYFLKGRIISTILAYIIFILIIPT